MTKLVDNTAKLIRESTARTILGKTPSVAKIVTTATIKKMPLEEQLEYLKQFPAVAALVEQVVTLEELQMKMLAGFEFLKGKYMDPRITFEKLAATQAKAVVTSQKDVAKAEAVLFQKKLEEVGADAMATLLQSPKALETLLNKKERNKKPVKTG